MKSKDIIKFNKRFKDYIERDFANVHRIITDSGKVIYSAGRNEDGHSDFVSALVLGVLAIKNKPSNISLPISFGLTSRFYWYINTVRGI